MNFSTQKILSVAFCGKENKRAMSWFGVTDTENEGSILDRYLAESTQEMVREYMYSLLDWLEENAVVLLATATLSIIILAVCDTIYKAVRTKKGETFITLSDDRNMFF